MEIRCSALLAATSILYLTLTVSTVSGKCVGRWAIHACFGGNGKRSDPSLSDNTASRHQNVLRQLLLPQTFLYDKSEDINPDDSQPVEPVNYEEVVRENGRRGEINTLELLLQTLMMEQRDRKKNSMMA